MKQNKHICVICICYVHIYDSMFKIQRYLKLLKYVFYISINVLNRLILNILFRIYLTTFLWIKNIQFTSNKMLQRNRLYKQTSQLYGNILIQKQTYFKFSIFKNTQMWEFWVYLIGFKSTHSRIFKEFSKVFTVHSE